MNETPSRFACSGCGATIDEEREPPFGCPARREGDGIDHVLVRELDFARIDPAPGPTSELPFLRYREFFHARHLGRAHGLHDDELDEIVERLDAAVAAEEGTGFRVTPFGRSAVISAALGLSEDGGVHAKDETGNVAGSHKARHLFGVLMYLEVRARLGWDSFRHAPLAIASCGNAALAAAPLARAAKRELDVFVPPAADPATLDELRGGGARVTICPRTRPGEGDPSVLRFREAVHDGAIPFTCQGSANGLAIEGGHTLGHELATQLRAAGRSLDRVFVQVGGGAFATAIATGLREARARGVLDRLPRLHAVQTTGAHPLARAWFLWSGRALGLPSEETLDLRECERRAALLRELPPARLEDELLRAARHRSDFMWPWTPTPVSVAEGILDDETYDWLAVLRAMVDSGGWPVVVDEDDVRRASEMSEGTPNPVSFTGSAGLAGVLRTKRELGLEPNENVAIFWSGVRRGRGG